MTFTVLVPLAKPNQPGHSWPVGYVLSSEEIKEHGLDTKKLIEKKLARKMTKTKKETKPNE